MTKKQKTVRCVSFFKFPGSWFLQLSSMFWAKSPSGIEGELFLFLILLLSHRLMIWFSLVFHSLYQDGSGRQCLLIERVMKSDAGWYTLSAINVAGMSTCNARLDIGSKCVHLSVQICFKGPLATICYLRVSLVVTIVAWAVNSRWRVRAWNVTLNTAWDIVNKCCVTWSSENVMNIWSVELSRIRILHNHPVTDKSQLLSLKENTIRLSGYCSVT